MRNLFDQYDSPENRLTHALACCLREDRRLLRRFVKWVCGRSPPGGARLRIVEQHAPGEIELSEEETERRGLPDAWICDDTEGGWALIIESKVSSRVRADQLRRHRRTAARRGFDDTTLVVISPETPKLRRATDDVHKTWSELYEWFTTQWSRSPWAQRFTGYLEAAESRMVEDGYLKQGTITRFSGICFDEQNPYNYREAKRLLGLAITQLRRRRDLRALGLDPHGAGRPAITGRSAAGIWDFIPLKASRAVRNFTEFPHLTLSIQRERVLAIVTVPNGIRPGLRRNLVQSGPAGFQNVIMAVEKRLASTLKKAAGAVPFLELIQRHYPTQRSEPICDARLESDLRTALAASRATGRRKAGVKRQPEWLDAAYAVLANKRSNVQLAVGAMFPHECKILHSKGAVDYFAKTWLACKPLLDTLLGKRRPKSMGD